jgi:predicted secreted Zn-dependent protease
LRVRWNRFWKGSGFGLRRFRLLAVGVGWGFVWSASAQSETKITTNYYTVSANTPRELRAALNREKAPKGLDASDARTGWNIQWTYRVAPADTGCQLRSFETRTTITVTLPKWDATPEAQPGMEQRWKDYLKALAKHEDGHRAIAASAATEMHKRVHAIKETPTCDGLTEAIKKAAHETLSEFRAKEAQYDRKTEHGATQGARLF